MQESPIKFPLQTKNPGLHTYDAINPGLTSTTNES